MQDERDSNQHAMAGGGFYNKHSTVQAALLTSALPLLEEAAGVVPIDGDVPLQIVDYGASEGRNAFAPVKLAIERLRARAGPSRAIKVVHTDLPSNDFSTLFTAVGSDPASYRADEDHIFTSAIGRSFYEPLVAPGRVHLGWSSNAIHWMSRNPMLVADHMAPVFSATPGAQEAVLRQQDEDWRAFLTARASELRPGGRLVCQFMGRAPDRPGFEYVADHYWGAIVDTGLLDEDERLRLTTPSAGRSLAQVEAPFAGGSFAGLNLLHLSSFLAPDPFWRQFHRDGDSTRFGNSWANMMRAVHGPTIAAALTAGRPANPVLDAIFARLAERLAAAPAPALAYQLLFAAERAAG